MIQTVIHYMVDGITYKTLEEAKKAEEISLICSKWLDKIEHIIFEYENEIGYNTCKSFINGDGYIKVLDHTMFNIKNDLIKCYKILDLPKEYYDSERYMSEILIGKVSTLYYYTYRSCYNNLIAGQPYFKYNFDKLETPRCIGVL